MFDTESGTGSSEPRKRTPEEQELRSGRQIARVRYEQRRSVWHGDFEPLPTFEVMEELLLNMPSLADVGRKINRTRQAMSLINDDFHYLDEKRRHLRKEKKRADARRHASEKKKAFRRYALFRPIFREAKRLRLPVSLVSTKGGFSKITLVVNGHLCRVVQPFRNAPYWQMSVAQSTLDVVDCVIGITSGRIPKMFLASSKTLTGHPSVYVRVEPFEEPRQRTNCNNLEIHVNSLEKLKDPAV